MNDDSGTHIAGTLDFQAMWMAELDTSEERRIALGECLDEMQDFRDFLTELLKDMADEPASYAVSNIEGFMQWNADKWYGGNMEHWTPGD